MEKCTKCGKPLKKEEDKCPCDKSLCIDCCECETGCACGCGGKGGGK